MEAAKKMLDESGWTDSDGDNIRDKVIDGVKTKMEFNLNYYTTQVEWKDIASMISESMYKAGVKANLHPLDQASMVLAARQHDFDMMLGSWASSVLPEDFTQLWHTSSWTSEGSNYAGFGNAATDALIDSIKYTLDENKRVAMVKRFQAYVYDTQPYIFMFASLRRVIIHKRFGNGEMYFERPGLLLNNLRLLAPGAVQANSSMQ
jgi:peptide/nickel transport system substrate-binding protein